MGEARVLFSLTDGQEELRAQVPRLCERFDDAYWLGRDRDGVFPYDFHAAMAEGGWLGIASRERILSHLAERVLGLPKSY